MDKYFEFIKNLLNVEENVAKIIGIGAAVLVLLLILLIILLIVRASKRKANKVIREEKREVTPAVEDNSNYDTLPTEEIQEEEILNLEEQETKKEEETNTETLTTKIPTSELKDILEEEERQQAQIKKKPHPKKKEEPKSLAGKFEIFPVNDVYLYRLRASNGEIIVTSEIYKSEKGAMQAVESIKENIDKGEVQISKDKHNLYQFRFYAANKRLLVVSANYPSEQGVENAAQSFKKFAPVSQVYILQEDPDHLFEEIKIKVVPNKVGGKIAIVKNDGDYLFQIQASNGAVLCSSSEYKTKGAVENGIEAFKESIRVGRFMVVRDKNDMYQYKLYNPNGRCIILGQAYKNKAQAISAANSLVAYISQATLQDQTGE